MDPYYKIEQFKDEHNEDRVKITVMEKKKGQYKTRTIANLSKRDYKSLFQTMRGFRDVQFRKKDYSW